MKVYREGKLPFPGGTIIVALHWNYVPSATGGWGFGDSKDGKPSDEALHKACFPCHEPAKARDFAFSQYAP